MAPYKEGMTLDAALRVRMKELGLNQSEAADQIGVKQPKLSKWLRMTDVPSDANLTQLADFLGVTVDEATLLASRTRAARRAQQEIRQRLARLEEAVDRILDHLGIE